jgi:hypothetical protein
MAVEQSMKLINMMRAKGWITVPDNDIWIEVSGDLSFSGPMRKHAADATRILAGNSGSPPSGGDGKKAPKDKKPKSDKTSKVMDQLTSTLTKLDEEASGRAKYGTVRWETAQQLGCDPAILVEGWSKQPGMGIGKDGTWKIPVTTTAAPQRDAFGRPLVNGVAFGRDPRVEC